VVSAFQWVGWVLLFERLTGGEEVSKLERIGADLRQCRK